jgi:hypothetical protein
VVFFNEERAFAQQVNNLVGPEIRNKIKNINGFSRGTSVGRHLKHPGVENTF